MKAIVKRELPPAPAPTRAKKVTLPEDKKRMVSLMSMGDMRREHERWRKKKQCLQQSLEEQDGQS